MAETTRWPRLLLLIRHRGYNFFHCLFLNGYYSRVVTIQRNMIHVLLWYEASRKYMVHESSEQKAEIPYSGKFSYGAKFCIFHINSRCKNLNYQKIFPCKILKMSKFRYNDISFTLNFKTFCAPRARIRIFNLWTPFQTPMDVCPYPLVLQL